MFSKYFGLLLLLLGSAQFSFSAGISFLWMDRPAAESVFLDTREGSAGISVDLKALGNALGAPMLVSSHRQRLRLDLPGASLIFTVGNPFVLADGRMMQMALPLESTGEGFFAPVEPTLEFIKNFYPGELLYDPAARRIMAAHPTGDLLGVRFDAATGGTRVVITAAKVLQPTTEPVGGGVKVVFPNAAIDADRLGIVEPRGCIQAVSVEQTERGVEMTFQPDGASRFERMDVSDDPPLCALSFTKEAASTPVDVSAKLSEDRDRWDLDVVVIDPGHGGKDPGAVSKDKLYEKEVALDVALRLRKALENRGVKTVMTRDSDKFLALQDRTRAANKAGGKLFISLHCNSAPDARAEGLETYFLSPSKNENARRVALKENSVIDYEDTKAQYQNLTEENFILLAMAQANFVRESQDLAVTVQERVGRGAGLKDRGVDQAGFYVLVGASMPAVLVEMGFLSNPKEEKRLRDKAFRQKLADGLTAAVMEFLKRAGGE